LEDLHLQRSADDKNDFVCQKLFVWRYRPEGRAGGQGSWKRQIPGKFEDVSQEVNNWIKLVKTSQ
jgi:hypothetical protein